MIMETHLTHHKQITFDQRLLGIAKGRDFLNELSGQYKSEIPKVAGSGAVSGYKSVFLTEQIEKCKLPSVLYDKISLTIQNEIEVSNNYSPRYPQIPEDWVNTINKGDTVFKGVEDNENLHYSKWKTFWAKLSSYEHGSVEYNEYLERNFLGDNDLRSFALNNYPFESDSFIDECSNRTIQLYEGIVNVLYVKLKRLPSEKSMKNWIMRYMIYSILDILEEKFKYHSGYLVCSLDKHTELPTSKDLFEYETSGVVIGGWVRRYMASSKISYENKLSLAFSLQNAKRAAGPISLYKQSLAVLDHMKNMVGHGYTATDEQKENLSGVVRKIDDLVRIHYPRDMQSRIPIWRLPSIAGCYENSAARYGAMGHLSQYKKSYDKQDVCYHAANLVVENQVRVSDYLIDEAGQVRWMCENPDDFIDRSVPIFSFGFNIEDLRKTLLYSAFRADKVQATYYKVLEPFKVRGVTVGNSEIYHLGRLIQPALHGCLRNEKGPFRFIGKKNNVEDINEVYTGVKLFDEEIRRSAKTPEDKYWAYRFCKTFFVAGDYKNATDNMHPALPEAFISALQKYTNLWSEWIKILRLTLGSHSINYDKFNVAGKEMKFRTKEDSDYYWNNLEVDMTWGQLMGSPTSFPVLNIVNAAMLWYSAEKYEGQRISWQNLLREYRPLFNGDDISFCSNTSHYAIWKDVCAGSGLSLSPGKNYCSVNYVNINSTTYINTLTPSDEEGFVTASQFRELFVVNPGLLKGQAKVLSDQRAKSVNRDEGLTPLCDQLETCVLAATPEEKVRCYETFLNYTMPRLKKSNRSWCLPRHLGGLGLPIGSANLSQFEIALRMCENYKDLSDIKEKGLFQDLGNEYWDQLKKNFPEIEFSKPEVLQMGQIDPHTDKNELPCLSMMFMTSEDSHKDQHLSAPTNKRGKKRKQRWIYDHPEKKFLNEKKKFDPRKKTNLSRQYKGEELRSLMLERLKATRLSNQGSSKMIKLDVCLPTTALHDMISEDISEYIEGFGGLDSMLEELEDRLNYNY